VDVDVGGPSLSPFTPLAGLVTLGLQLASSDKPGFEHWEVSGPLRVYLLGLLCAVL
jgi:hypothetical protein